METLEQQQATLWQLLLSPDQLDQFGKHGTPHRPRDQPSDATGGKSHVDLALITKSDDTSLHQELGLLNRSLGCLTVPRSRSLSDIVHVAGDTIRKHSS